MTEHDHSRKSGIKQSVGDAWITRSIKANSISSLSVPDAIAPGRVLSGWPMEQMEMASGIRPAERVLGRVDIPSINDLEQSSLLLMTAANRSRCHPKAGGQTGEVTDVMALVGWYCPPAFDAGLHS